MKALRSRAALLITALTALATAGLAATAGGGTSFAADPAVSGSDAPTDTIVLSSFGDSTASMHTRRSPART